MMEFVADAGHLGASDNLRIGGRGRIEVEHTHRVVAAIPGFGIEGGDVGQLFARPLHRHPRRRIERLIRLPEWHRWNSVAVEVSATLMLLKRWRKHPSGCVAYAKRDRYAPSPSPFPWPRNGGTKRRRRRIEGRTNRTVVSRRHR